MQQGLMTRAHHGDVGQPEHVPMYVELRGERGSDDVQ
jgi:hypothetical protein